MRYEDGRHQLHLHPAEPSRRSLSTIEPGQTHATLPWTGDRSDGLMVIGYHIGMSETLDSDDLKT